MSTATLNDHIVKEFAASLRGRVLRPGDSDYNQARAVWNGMIDKHPALIVQCADAQDVMTAVAFARENDIPGSVRGGGHNIAGNALCDDGIVIDLSLMKQVEVDPQARTARAGGGVTWGEFDRVTQEYGLAVTGGLVSTTGIGGFTLGGGMGWLERKHGLTCDNLIAAEVVTAEGKLGGEPRPLLGAARRRRQFRHSNRVHIPAASRRSRDPGRTDCLAVRGGREDSAVLP